MNEIEKIAYFNKVISDNEKAIRRIVAFYCYEKQFMEDLYQEIVASIWEGLDRFKSESKIETWIYRIAINISILHNKRYIKRKHIITHSSIECFTDLFPPNDANVMIEQLYLIIEHLNTIEKAIILLYIDKYSHKEIAEIIGLSKTNIGTKISRIIKKMKDINNITEK